MHGLSAFPLTPLRDDHVDEDAFVGLVSRLAAAGVDSITALGSTGSYAYLSVAERARVCDLAVEAAGGTPVFIGIGALRTSDVLANIRSAERAGAAGVLLAPMTYQPLTSGEVLELYRTVTASTELPVIVYDNPGTTRFTFSLDLYARIAALPGIASIKIPGTPLGGADAAARVSAIRAEIPSGVTIGVSGDAYAAAGLMAGCDAWYSVVGGVLPEPALALTRAAQQGRFEDAQAASAALAPLWSLFADHGSIRVVASMAEHLGLVSHPPLPLPVQSLPRHQHAHVRDVLDSMELSLPR